MSDDVMNGNDVIIWSNVPGKRPTNAQMAKNGRFFINQHDAVLGTLKADGSVRFTTLGDNIIEPLSSVLDYGAYNDDTHEDETLAAFEAALAANSTIYVPPGKYRLGGKIIQDLVGNYAKFVLKGAGRGETILHFPNADGGIEINKTDASQSCTIQDVTITTGQADGGNAIKITQAAPLSSYAGSSVQNVNIRAEDNSGDLGVGYWTNGVYIIGDCGGRYYDVNIWGTGGHDTAVGVGFRVAGVIPLGSLGYSIDTMIAGCTLNNLEYGVYVSDLTQTVNVNQCFMVNCKNGMLNSGDDVVLSDSVVNASVYCFVCQGPSLSPRVIGNYFELPAAANGFIIQDTDGFVVAGNRFVAPAAASDHGVTLLNSKYGTIVGNAFKNMNVAMLFDATSTNNEVSCNAMETTTYPFEDYGTGNWVSKFKAMKLWDGTVMQPVTIGAADSGGAGYRALRIPN